MKLWAFVAAKYEPPSNETWTRWLAAYNDEELEKAIVQVLHRFRNQKPDSPEAVHRFVTSTLALLRTKRNKQKPPAAALPDQQNQEGGTAGKLISQMTSQNAPSLLALMASRSVERSNDDRSK